MFIVQFNTSSFFLIRKIFRSRRLELQEIIGLPNVVIFCSLTFQHLRINCTVYIVPRMTSVRNDDFVWKSNWKMENWSFHCHSIHSTNCSLQFDVNIKKHGKLILHSELWTYKSWCRSSNNLIHYALFPRKFKDFSIAK